MSLIQNTKAFFLCLLVCSCCFTPIEEHTEKDYLQPEWEASISTFESPYIYYDGLPNLPMYDNLIIAHTTIKDEGMWEEDNRLCAINTETGTVDWYFPSDLSVASYCGFNHEGYIYGNKLVFQYQKDARTYESRRIHTTVCLDASTGETIWEESFNSDDNHGSVRDVVGSGDTCYFVKDSTVICKVDIANDIVEEFYDTDSLHINGLSMCDNYLALSCNVPANSEFNYNTYAMVLNKDTGEKILLKYLSTDSIWAHCDVYGGIIYCSVYKYLTAINISTGLNLWERSDPGADFAHDMYVFNSVLLKCADDETVGYNKITGDIIYEYKSYGSWYSAADGRYAYIVNRKGYVDVIDIESGKVLDSIKSRYSDMSDSFFGSYPVIYDNKLYIMSYNHLFRYPSYPWP